MSRSSRILLPVLCLQMSLMIMATNHAGSVGSESVKHEVLLEHYKNCKPQWKPVKQPILKGHEILVCPPTEQSGANGVEGEMYLEASEGYWTAYAFGVPGKDFLSQEQARAYVDSQLAYWLRPKAEWWKFWKEFKERP